MALPTAAFDPAQLPLKGPHLPPEVGFWPPAPGWWLLLALLPALGLLLWWLRRRHRAGVMKRQALRELAELSQQPAEMQLDRLSRLLRRCAIRHFPKAECAGLQGDVWLAFLDRPFSDHPFSTGVGEILTRAPYAPEATKVPPELLQLCRRWIKRLPRPSKTTGRRS